MDVDVARSVSVIGWANSGGPIQSSGRMLDPSIGVLAWVRATPGSGQFSTTLALWQLPTPNRNTNATFTVGQEWTLISGAHDLERGGSIIRIEFYLETVGKSLDISTVLTT